MPFDRPDAAAEEKSSPVTPCPEGAAARSGASPLGKPFFAASFKSTVRSLRFRLMIWNSLVMALVALAALVGLRVGVSRVLLLELDQRLAADAREIELTLAALAAPSQELFDELNRKAQGHALEGWFVQLLDAAGNQTFASLGGLPTGATLPVGGSVPAGKPQPPATWGQHRILQHVQAGEPRYRILVGASLQPIQTDIDRIDRLMLAGAGVMLLLAPLGGYWLAGRVTRPFARMIQTMTRLRPSELDERLPLRNTGDELDQLALTFNGLLDRIADYLNEHRDFLANAAHELRSPLAAIRSTVEVALHSERTREEYEELLQGVIAEDTSLEVLVNQLLLLAETEADRITGVGEEVSLDEVVVKSVEMFRAVAESRGQDFRLLPPAPVRLHGHRHHLRQLLNNLLDNAIKFTPAGGRIVIDLNRDDVRQQAVLHVQDTGIGVNPDDVQRMFQRFYRVDKSRRRDPATHGSGLGLSICKAVVEAHGGQISVTSQPGAGTTFTVCLPLLTGHD
jgi:heavy metal sensor kinase